MQMFRGLCRIVRHRASCIGDGLWTNVSYTSVWTCINKTISVAIAEGLLRRDVREHGRIAHTPTAVKRLAVKLAKPGAVLEFCYEAGPCGYGLQRQLSELGHHCAVVAPSLIAQAG